MFSVIVRADYAGVASLLFCHKLHNSPYLWAIRAAISFLTSESEELSLGLLKISFLSSS
jgi:hypothetical protein